jgi:hypothetical protein
MNAAGYNVSVLVVHVPNEVAEARNLERARSEGRHVDPELLRALYVAVSRSHLEWRSLEWLGWTMHSGD